MVMADKLAADWLTRLKSDKPGQSEAEYRGVVNWLLGNSPENLQTLNSRRCCCCHAGNGISVPDLCAAVLER